MFTLSPTGTFSFFHALRYYAHSACILSFWKLLYIFVGRGNSIVLTLPITSPFLCIVLVRSSIFFVSVVIFYSLLVKLLCPKILFIYDTFIIPSLFTPFLLQLFFVSSYSNRIVIGNLFSFIQYCIIL